MSINFDVVASVRHHLDEHDWHYSYDEERNVINTGGNIGGKLRRVDMVIRFTHTGYKVVAISPVSADEDSMEEVMRYLAMANYGMINGNFELDVRDGEIRFKVYNCLDGLNSLPDEMIAESILVPAMMMKKYGDGIAALCMGFSDAKTEYDKTQAD